MKKKLIISILIAFSFICCGKLHVKKKYLYSEYLMSSIKLNDSINLETIFDTGAGFFYIDSLFSQRHIKVKNYFYHDISGIGSSTKRAMVVVDTLKLSMNSYNYDSAINAILDLKNFAGKEIDGVLGNILFREYKIFICSKKKTIQIIEDTTTIDFSKYKKIPYQYKNGKMIVEAETSINNKINFKGRYLIDTGYPGLLSLKDSISRDLKIEKNIANKAYYYSSMYGIGGKSEGFRFIAKSVQLSDFKLEKIITDCSKDSTGGFSTSQGFDGLIGYGLLKKFDIIFDFKNQIMYLKPGDDYNTIYKHPNMGFSYVDRCDIGKGLIVSSIIKNSNAEKSGIKLNDRIIEINNHKIEGITDSQLTKIKKKKKFKYKIIRNQNTIELKVKRNKIL